MLRRRIREGQEIAGVCTGLAAYADLGVDRVRTLFVLGTLVTAGILGLVWIALAFILPIAATRGHDDKRRTVGSYGVSATSNSRTHGPWSS